MRYLLAPTMAFCFAVPVAAQERGPANGSIVLVGGGQAEESIFKRIIELAGGPSELIVVIPTAGGAKTYDDTNSASATFRNAGAKNVVVLHTLDRKLADTQQFVEPLRKARGVYIGGGDQTLLADTYVHTRTHREMTAILARGGVIAGNSAGAMIIGSFLLRGIRDLPMSSPIVIGDRVEGFGFLQDVTILPHVLSMNRQFDLLRVISLHPDLLGLGISENTAIVVIGDKFDVIGRSVIAIYDNTRVVDPDGTFYFLQAGDSYNLMTREPAAVRGLQNAPFPRLIKKTDTPK